MDLKTANDQYNNWEWLREQIGNDIEAGISLPNLLEAEKKYGRNILYFVNQNSSQDAIRYAMSWDSGLYRHLSEPTIADGMLLMKQAAYLNKYIENPTEEIMLCGMGWYDHLYDNIENPTEKMTEKHKLYLKKINWDIDTTIPHIRRPSRRIKTIDELEKEIKAQQI